MDEKFIVIENIEQFIKIRDLQNAKEICTRKEVKEIVENLKKEKKGYTIFSLQDDSEETWYITYGVRWVNNIGYYVLEGNYKLPNDLEY